MNFPKKKNTFQEKENTFQENKNRSIKKNVLKKTTEEIKPILDTSENYIKILNDDKEVKRFKELGESDKVSELCRFNSTKKLDNDIVNRIIEKSNINDYDKLKKLREYTDIIIDDKTTFKNK